MVSFNSRIAGTLGLVASAAALISCAPALADDTAPLGEGAADGQTLSEPEQIISADSEDAQPSPQSEFIGTYNGNSFETAMGMIIRADGTFAWGLSVGALDMRAKGSWRQDGQTITLTSDPVPVAPEFGWIGYETVPDGPLIKVVWASNGEPFEYASVNLTCRNGAEFYDQVHAEGWSPSDGECDEPVSVQLTESIHNVTSDTYDIAGTFNPGDGGTVLFEFRPGDMGVADFTGMVGVLEDGVLTLHGGEWPMELRKVR